MIDRTKSNKHLEKIKTLYEVEETLNTNKQALQLIFSCGKKRDSIWETVREGWNEPFRDQKIAL